MKVKFATLLAIVGTFSIAATHVQTAHAASINTMASDCRSSTTGTPATPTNSGVVNNTTGAMTVFCSIPRSPLATGSTAGVFFVDGTNPAGGSTTCNVFSFDFTNTFMAGTGKVSTAATYDLVITINAAQLPMFSYTSVVCQLPPGGRLLGVTSVQ